LLHLAVSLHGQRQLVYVASSADADSHGWQLQQVAFSCQQYLLQPDSGAVTLQQQHVLTQQSGDNPVQRP
jgi:hypothetical protein